MDAPVIIARSRPILLIFVLQFLFLLKSASVSESYRFILTWSTPGKDKGAFFNRTFRTGSPFIVPELGVGS